MCFHVNLDVTRRIETIGSVIKYTSLFWLVNLNLFLLGLNIYKLILATTETDLKGVAWQQQRLI